MPIEFKDETKRGRRLKRGIGRPPMDVQRLAQAVSGPGIDTRTWLASGTVGSTNDEGEFVTKDNSGRAIQDAVYVDRLGAVADVRLEPSGDFVTARWNGISCGRFGVMLFPLIAGDQVLVAIPDGDLNSPNMTIINLISDTTSLIPENWKNDRVLFRLNVAMEIRGPGIEINSSNLQINGRRVAFGPENI